MKSLVVCGDIGIYDFSMECMDNLNWIALTYT